jgi:TorA maturation chaperone TorD
MTTAGIEALDAERGRLFLLLGRLLATPPDTALLGALAGLPRGLTPVGAALAAVANAACATDEAAVTGEFHSLFIGVGRGELLPYASFYLTGFLHERPLAALRQDLARLGIAPAFGRAEPEDHIASLCEVAGGLLTGAFEGGRLAADRFIAGHLQPWAGRCFADLAAADAAAFYRPVGQLGRTLLEIEAGAAALAA